MQNVGICYVLTVIQQNNLGPIFVYFLYKKQRIVGLVKVKFRIRTYVFNEKYESATLPTT